VARSSRPARRPTIFTKNVTEAINSSTLVRDARTSDRCDAVFLCHAEMENHAKPRPWQMRAASVRPEIALPGGDERGELCWRLLRIARLARWVDRQAAPVRVRCTTC